MNNKRILDLYLCGKLGRALHDKTDQIGSLLWDIVARANPLAKVYSSFFIGMEIERPLSQFSCSPITLLSLMISPLQSAKGVLTKYLKKYLLIFDAAAKYTINLGIA